MSDLGAFGTWLANDCVRRGSTPANDIGQTKLEYPDLTWSCRPHALRRVALERLHRGSALLLGASLWANISISPSQNEQSQIWRTVHINAVLEKSLTSG